MNQYLISEEEIKKYEQEFEAFWQRGLQDKRSYINFPTISNEKEKIIISDLVNFIFYYISNKNIVDKYLIDTGREVNVFSIIDFWYNEIGKSEELDLILSDFSVFPDCIKYFEDALPLAEVLREDFETKNIFRKKIFRSKNTYNKLKIIIDNKDSYKYREKYKELMTFFKDYNIDENHISEKLGIEILNYLNI